MLFAFFIFCSFTKHDTSLNENIIEVYFSNKLDIYDLAKIKTDLQQQEIKLDHHSLKFGKDGKLTPISYNVNAGKFSGADSTDDTLKEISFIINKEPYAKY